MKQTWGLIIADPNEVDDHGLEFLKKTIMGSTIFSHYQWQDVEIIVIESGIGLVNAAMFTQKLIDFFPITKVLNYGAVGATSKVKLFDVIIPKKFYFHDVETPWYPKGQTPGEKEFYLNALHSENNINIASGNSFIFQQEHLAKIKQDFDVDLFDMESCAIAQVCDKNNIPFYCVKGISDLIDITSANKDDINHNINQAAQKSLKHLIDLFPKIKSLN